MTTPILHAKILGSGKPLLILHGLLGMGDNWISLGRQYAQNGFEVHLIDQRNHGKSFHNTEMDYEVMTDDLLYYIQAHQLDKVAIMGHSMGGKTAMYFGLKYPELVEKLLIADIAPKFYPPHHHFIFEAINSIDLKKYLDRKSIEQALSNKITDPAIRQFIMKNLARSKDHTFYWKANIPVLEASLDALGAGLPPMEVIDIPALFIKGEKSPYMLEDDFSLINAHFPQANIITIPGAGHWLHAQQPQLFYKQSTSFLAKK